MLFDTHLLIQKVKLPCKPGLVFKIVVHSNKRYVWHRKVENISFFSFGVSGGIRSHCTPQAGLELMVLLFLFPEY